MAGASSTPGSAMWRNLQAASYLINTEQQQQQQQQQQQ
jgi:hypothetical protein